MDTTDPDITFDDSGFCNHCTSALTKLKRKPYSLPENEKLVWLEQLAAKIRSEGRGKKYDCIIGVSGGVDSSYVAYLVKKLKLRPLAVHLDNGWNSELSVNNIQNICQKLSIDLYTEVLNWSKYKNIQLAFLKSLTPDLEIPTDHAIFASLYRAASKYGTKYILSGSNLATESILPFSWAYGHNDWTYIKDVVRKNGEVKYLKGFPHYSFTKYLYYRFFKKIKWVSTLDYVNYDKQKAKELIKAELAWRDYGGKHHESIITKFLQSYILPYKFNIDKRKAHLSSQIVSNQVTRAEAIESLKQPLYCSESEMIQERDYVIKKLGLSHQEFDKIMNSENLSYTNYKNHYNTRITSFLINIYKKQLNVQQTI